MSAPEPVKPGGSAFLPPISRLKGGVVLSATIALAASFLSEHYGAPAMLFALLIGMAFNFMADNPSTGPGIGFCSGTVLRIGVALLGLQLTFADISQLGFGAILGVIVMLSLTLAVGIGLSRLMGRSLAFGLLTGGSVAICGASAALAIAAALPKRLVREQDVLFTVIGVTALSTLAMVLYPILFAALGLSELESGYLIGATIHDVAQVVGAGYSIGEEAGEIATFTKLLRVSMLPLVLIFVGLCFRSDSGGAVRLPGFVIAFILLMVLRNLVLLPEWLLTGVSGTSRFMLLTAIAALGVRTALARIFAAGPRNLILIGLETLALLGMALCLAAVLRI
ncbi:YeiH family protein [Paracoccus aerodenitrificans]|uniref:YeiH family protein n=1 Tax=Paracoccus aerodenitrificans TaxID=3017781 RepID=UPI0022F01A25|nr:putative sulfate exporter family transporter [Paracoccus aerodenitrificans]WBU63903.1 putative sulfate exporter family transporter [Paracoccus aerodenitrificans]